MLEFDVNVINKNRIELLDCQVDLILKSLEMYCYMYKFIYPRKKLTNEENLRITLVTDTFEQILNQYKHSKKERKIDKKVNKKIKNLA